MKQTEATRIDLTSARVAAQALAGEWSRSIPWPDVELGAYGSGATGDAELDDYVLRVTGTRPGGSVHLGHGNPPGVLSACAGRRDDGSPCIRLSVRPAPGAVVPPPGWYVIHPDGCAWVAVQIGADGTALGIVEESAAACHAEARDSWAWIGAAVESGGSEVPLGVADAVCRAWSDDADPEAVAVERLGDTG